MTLRDDFEIGILEVDTAFIIHITRTVPIFDAKDSHLAASAVTISLTNATICISALLGNHFFHAISDGDGAASAIISRSDASCIIAARSLYCSAADEDITAGITISTADTCSIIAARSSNRSTLNDNITTVPPITTTDSCTTHLAYSLERRCLESHLQKLSLCLFLRG